MAAPRIGLALGSGSARGWSHIGIIESLAEAGIEADIVCGTSMGSLVGAVYVAGHLTELRQWAETATWREIVGLMDVRLSGGGLISGKQVVSFLKGLGVEEPIEATPNHMQQSQPIWSVAARFGWSSGPIHEAVRASIALPGILVRQGSAVNGLSMSSCSRTRTSTRRRPRLTSTTTRARRAFAGTRLLVQRSILDEFLERFEAKTNEIKVGDPRDPDTTYGPLIHPVALERVTGHVERALAAGAHLAFGGQPIRGLYYPPTPFTDVPPNAEILQKRCSAQCSPSRPSPTTPKQSS